MSKIANSVAEKDLEKFFDEMKVDPLKRKKLFSEGENGRLVVSGLIELLCEGMAVVNDSGEIEYKLLEPIASDSGTITLETVVFKPKRITLEKFQKIQDKKDDVEQMKMILSFITGESSSLLGKISMDDWGYLSEIGLVFL
ncbi:MAG: hypothetical protein PF486_06115 [Prolixibacteraceae bacterium]|jgi:hypothetical protein|nr:hypothetical protein [Prolixibacteraceae bacterium]